MTHRLTVMPFLIAFLAAVAAMPTNVYQICAWGAGTLEVEPWLSRSSGAVRSAAKGVLAFFSGLWNPKIGFACAAIIMALLISNLNSGHDGVVMAIAGAGFATRPKFEAEMNEAKAKAKAAMELAEKEDRELTDVERKDIQAHLDAAKEAKAKIDRVDADMAMFNEVNGLSAGTAPKPNAEPAAQRGRILSLGEQYVASADYKTAQGYAKLRATGWKGGGSELQAATLTTDAASGGDLIVADQRPGILPLLFKRLTIADLLSSGTTDSNLISYMKETTFTNAAAAVAEGGAKPESTLIFDAVSDAVKKIAHWLPVTDEMLEDVSQIRSYIDARLRLGLDMTEEDQLLNGSGTGANIQGLLNRSGLAAAQARSTDTNEDAIFKQIWAIFTNSFLMPDGVAMNPTNWQTIALRKDTAGQYIFSSPASGSMTAQRLWGIPVVVTPSMTANSALVGAYKQGAQVFRKGGTRVEASNSHADFFTRNLTAIRAEERLALAVYRPASFGTVTGLN